MYKKIKEIIFSWDALFIITQFIAVLIPNVVILHDLYENKIGIVILAFILYFVAITSVHFLYIGRIWIGSWGALFLKIFMALILELGLALILFDAKETSMKVAQHEEKVQQYKKSIDNEIEQLDKKLREHVGNYTNQLNLIYGKEYTETLYKYNDKPKEIQKKLDGINVFLEGCEDTEKNAKIIAETDFPILTEDTKTKPTLPNYSRLNQCSNNKITHTIRTLDAEIQGFQETQEAINKLKRDKALENNEEINVQNEKKDDQNSEYYLEKIIGFFSYYWQQMFFVVLALLGSSAISANFYAMFILKKSQTDKIFPRDSILETLFIPNLSSNGYGMTTYDFLKDKRIVKLNKDKHQNIIKELHIKGKGIKKGSLMKPDQINTLISLALIQTQDTENNLFYMFDKKAFDRFFVYNSRLDDNVYFSNPQNSATKRIIHWVKINKLTVLLCFFAMVLIICGVSLTML